MTDAQLVLGRLRPGAYASLRSVSRPGRSPRGHRNARGAAARTVGRGRGCRHHRGARAEPAARRRIHLDRAGLRATPVYIGGGRRRRAHARDECRAGARLPGGSTCRAMPARLCAIGMLHADVRQDFQSYVKGTARRARAEPSRRRVGQIGRSGPCGVAGRGFWSRPGRSRASDRSALPRPALVNSRSLGRADGSSAAATRRAFEAEYQRLYGHVQPDGAIMAASLRVAARAATGTPKARRMEASARNGTGKPDGSRSVWHDKHGWLDTAIYDGSGLGVGDRVSGPAVVEERTTTVLLGPGDRAHRRRHRQLHDRGGARCRSRARFAGAVGASRARARSRDSCAHAEPARSDQQAHGLGDDAHGPQPDLQPEPRLLLLHHRPRRHADRQRRWHSDPYRRRRLCRAGTAAGISPAASIRRTCSSSRTPTSPAAIICPTG